MAFLLFRPLSRFGASASQGRTDEHTEIWTTAPTTSDADVLSAATTGVGGGGAAGRQAAAVRRPQRRRARGRGAWIRPWRVKICRMHRLLILSRHARDYHRLVDAARLPDLAVTSTSDPADAAPRAGDYDLAFGEPSLLRQVLPSMASLRWTQATWAGVEPLLDPVAPPRLHPDQCTRRFRRTDVRVRVSPISSRTNAASSKSTRRKPPADGTRAVPGRCAANNSGCSALAPSAPRSRAPRSIRHERQRLYPRQRGQPGRRRLVSRIDGRPGGGVCVRSRLLVSIMPATRRRACSSMRSSSRALPRARGVRQSRPRRRRR